MFLEKKTKNILDELKNRLLKKGEKKKFSFTKQWIKVISEKVLLCLFISIVFCIAGEAQTPQLFKYESKHFKSENEGYSVTVEYPHVTDQRIPPKEQKRINKLIERYVYRLYGGALRTFKKQSTQTKIETGSAGIDTVDISYQINRFDSKYLSIKFDKYFYGIGGAHGLPTIHSFNYDFQTKRILSLGDLFKFGSGYLKEISRYCISDLEKKLSKDNAEVMMEWLEAGAAATRENYRQFGITENELIIYFDVYQVACYVSGSQAVHIPFSALNSLKQESMLCGD